MFISLDEFYEKIIKSDEYCFICLSHNSKKTFNNEHILPKWILKKFKLFDKKIILPNKSSITYGHYVIPCCLECNRFMSKFYEKPISNFLKLPYEEIIEEINSKIEIKIKLFHWIALIFMKTHIKTTFLNQNKNPKLNSGKISDLFDWVNLHHIYIMCRAHYTKSNIHNNVYGSFFIVQGMSDENNNFDYVDSSLSRCILIKLGELSLFCCLDDCKVGNYIINDMLQNTKQPYHPLQLREILAHLSFININLKNRPIFFSSIQKNNEHLITVKFPDEPPTIL